MPVFNTILAQRAFCLFSVSRHVIVRSAVPLCAARPRIVYGREVKQLNFASSTYISSLQHHRIKSRPGLLAAQKEQEITLTSEMKVEAAIAAATLSLGRIPGPNEELLVHRLQSNWFATVHEMLQMTEAEAMALQVPIRLLSHMRNMAAAADTEASTATELVDSLLISDSLQSQLADLPRDIMARKAPPSNRFNNLAGKVAKVEDMPEALQAEFASFRKFCTVKFYGQQQDPIAQVTAKKYEDHLRAMLGWLHWQQGVALEMLSLSSMVPSPDRSGVEPAFNFIQWLSQERGVSAVTEMLSVRSIMAAAKYLYHAQSKARPAEGDKSYDDILVVRELRNMVNDAKRRTKTAPRAADEAKKWLQWPEYLRVVAELRNECAGLDHCGQKRKRSAVAWSLQRYLIFAILSCVPDRQRTIRELEVGRTLFNEGGCWLIRHKASDYKTGKSYGERPPMQLAPSLYPELEEFLTTWRAELQPQHPFVFSQLSGSPLTEQGVHKIFRTSAYRIAGKMTNPHLVRDMVVTHLRGTGASETELEALALYMGHSLAMQRSTYDRRTKADKVKPAVDLLAALNASPWTDSAKRRGQ